MYGDILLAVVTIDANNGLFPLVVVVVERETYESWGWFFGTLYHFLRILYNKLVTFMSGNQKGIIKALKELYPQLKGDIVATHLC